MIPDETVSVIGIYRCNILKLTETELLNVMKHTSLSKGHELVSIGQPRSKLSSANWNDVYHERNPKFSPYKVHWIFIYFQTTITFQLYFCAK